MTVEEKLELQESLIDILTLGQVISEHPRIKEVEARLRKKKERPELRVEQQERAAARLPEVQVYQRTLNDSESFGTMVLLVKEALKRGRGMSQKALAKALGDPPLTNSTLSGALNNVSTMCERLGPSGYDILDTRPRVGSGTANNIKASDLLLELWEEVANKYIGIIVRLTEQLQKPERRE